MDFYLERRIGRQGGRSLEISGDSIDQILIDAYDRVVADGVANVGSRGPNKELLGVTFRMRFPRARLSRSADRGLPFSALGEFLWYLTGGDDPDFITAYIPRYADEVGKSGKINGAYGPRIFSRYGLNQLEALSYLLERKPNTRRAVVQIYSGEDLLTDEEVPCTTTIQFFLRSGLLHLAVSLRSNDAYLGLPHDVFCFTMLQEMIARKMGVELGEYIQMVGSFHLYDRDVAKVARYQKEGHHRLAEMPAMPVGDPFSIVPKLHAIESRIRRYEPVDDDVTELGPYWGDLMRLVQVHFNSDNNEFLNGISARLVETTYRTYLEDRRGRPVPKR